MDINLISKKMFYKKYTYVYYMHAYIES